MNNFLKDTVLKQKREKERLLSLSYIQRTKEQEARKWLDSDLIKVVVGPRRAGKSIFSLMLLKDRPFAYFNFDDESLPGRAPFEYEELMKELHFAYGDTKNILFDEIQNLPKWELFLNRLQREGYNMTITGSNAKLLSKELATALTGRHIPIEILPFDFKEYVKAKNYPLAPIYSSLPEEKAGALSLLDGYLRNGGFPELVVSNLDPQGYLGVLFDSLLFKDVVKRHKVRFSQQIDDLGSYLINNVASAYSLRKLVNTLGFKSGVTLEKYLGYLTEAYLLFTLGRYSPKAGERIRSPKKVYVVDNGLISAKAVQHSPDNGKLMENLVFVELVKRGYKPNRDLFYYKTRNDREVDFVLKKGTEETELIQVVYQIKDNATEQREIKSLTEAEEELKTGRLTIITWDDKKIVKRPGVDINFSPLWDWMQI